MPSRGQRLREAQAIHRQRNFERVLAHLRNHPCVDCGETDPVVLDFDHLPGFEKRFEIARAVGASTRSWRSIAEEIEKCDVVCANCHRRRTARRGGHRKFQAGISGTVDRVTFSVPAQEPVPHGGGAKGRRGCPCEPCRRRRREYARSWRSSRRVAERDEET